MAAGTPGKLSVLMVSQLMVPFLAGAELKALRLARGLMSRGVRVELVTTRFRRGLPGLEVIEGVAVRRLSVLPDEGASSLGAPRFPYFVRGSQFLRLALHVAMEGRRFDVVHAHCISASALGAVLGAKIAKRPVVVEPSLAGWDGEVRRVMASPERPLARRLLGLVDLFAVKAEEIGQELREIGIPDDRIRSVANPVDLTRFRPASEAEKAAIRQRLGLPQGPLALFVGQLLERKGVPRLLQAWPAVRAERPEASLVFIGEGVEGEAVRQVASDPNVGLYHLPVRFDIWEVMRSADVLVLPSRNESFANVVVEALAAGVPVVAGRTGIAQRIRVAEAGRLLESGQPDEIAAALSEVLGMPDRGRALGSRGPELVREFDLDTVSMAYESMYRELIAARTRA